MTGYELRGVKEIVLNDNNKYKCQFTINAMIDLQKKFGSFKKVFAALGGDNLDFEVIRYFLYVGLKKHHKNLTEEEVGELIDFNNLTEIVSGIFAGIRMGNPLDEKGKVVEEDIPSRD